MGDSEVPLSRVSPLAAAVPDAKKGKIAAVGQRGVMFCIAVAVRSPVVGA